MQKILSWKKKDYTQIFEKIYLWNQIKKGNDPP